MTFSIQLLIQHGTWSLQRCLVASAAVLALAGTTNAASFTGKVVRIVDGDTLTVLDDEKREEIRVRLSGIDAPEHSQAWGERSRQHLARVAFAKRVSVEWYKTSYNRVIGVVLADGVDVSLAQVKVGLAWHYKRYETEQAPKDRKAYAAAELDARKERRGLWQDSEPIPPWDFRRRRY